MTEQDQIVQEAVIAVAGEPLVPGDVRDYEIEHTKMVLEAGWLGKIFGASANAPTNIAGLVLLLFVGACVFIILRAGDAVNENMKVVLPVITLALGYLFGRKT